MDLFTPGSTTAIQARLFLVGCPRSGTTLLQSMLAAHSQITSFPESHFLLITSRSRRGRWLRKLGLVAPEMRQRLQQFLTAVDRPDLMPPRMVRLSPFVQQFVGILDELTMARGQSIWLEKTPGHLYYIDDFVRARPDARFIHLLRGGADVVASLFDVTNHYPERWGGAYTVSQCVRTWNNAVQLSRYYCGRNMHYCVRYEDLISQPEATLRALCHFIGVAFEPAMLTERCTAATRLFAPDEHWKAATLTELDLATHAKFKRIFTAEEQRTIVEQLIAIEA